MTQRRPKRSRGVNPLVLRYGELAEAITSTISDVPIGWQALEPSTRDMYHARVDQWHALMSELYDPLYAALDAVIRGDESDRDRLICFLEADVYCHRSGYFKADAIRALTRRELPATERSRLSRVLFSAVVGPDRREFRSYVRLARALNDADVRSRLEALAISPEPRTARHARWILEGLGLRSPQPDNWDDGLMSTLLRLLGGPASAMAVDELGAVLADGAAALDEPYRTAFESLAEALRSSPGGRISSQDLAAVRERFEAAMRSFSTRDQAAPSREIRQP